MKPMAGVLARWWAPILAAVLVSELGHSSRAVAEIAEGKGDFTFVDERGNADKPIRVWTYRPAGFHADSPIVFVMHGTLRNGEEYRQPWMPIADRHPCLIVVPEFSSRYYPGQDAYHFGNLRSADGQRIEESRWTFSAIEHLFDHVKREVGSRCERYCIFGHSAGSQFVHRLVLFKPSARVAWAVSANAGSYTLPTYQAEFPYGLNKSDLSEERLRQALGAPLVVLLGEKDTDPNDRYLPRAAGARAQGAHRFERGQNFLRTARAEADRLRVDLKWTVVTVPDVGHDNALMAPAAVRIFFGR